MHIDKRGVGGKSQLWQGHFKDGVGIKWVCRRLHVSLAYKLHCIALSGCSVTGSVVVPQ